MLLFRFTVVVVVVVAAAAAVDVAAVIVVESLSVEFGENAGMKLKKFPANVCCDNYDNQRQRVRHEQRAVGGRPGSSDFKRFQ